MQIEQSPFAVELKTINLDGEIWFAGADVNKILGINRTYLSREVAPTDKRKYPVPTLNGTPQNQIFINRSGLNVLIRHAVNRTAINWLKTRMNTEERMNMSYDPNSPQARKGALGEEIVKKYLELQGYTVERPVDTFKSGASIVDFAVYYRDGTLSHFAEVKTREAFPYGVEKTPTYSFLASRIDAYRDYGKKHGNKPVYLYIVDASEGYIFYRDLSVLENYQIPIEGRKYPFEQYSETLGGTLRYYNVNQFHVFKKMIYDDHEQLRAIDCSRDAQKPLDEESNTAEKSPNDTATPPTPDETQKPIAEETLTPTPTGAKLFAEKLAAFVGISKADLAQAILDLRQKKFDREQEQFKELLA